MWGMRQLFAFHGVYSSKTVVGSNQASLHSLFFGMADIDPKSERNGILGSIVIHALLFVAFIYIEAKPEPVDQLGYIQVEFGEFAEGRPVQSVPESVPEPTPPPEEPELEEL